MLPGQEPGQKGFENAKAEQLHDEIIQMKKDFEESGMYSGMVEYKQSDLRKAREEAIRKQYLAALNSVQGLPLGTTMTRFNHSPDGGKRTWEIAELIFPSPPGLGTFPASHCLAWVRGAPSILFLEDQKTFDPMFFCYFQKSPTVEGFGPNEQQARELVQKMFDNYWNGPNEYVPGKGMVPRSDSPVIKGE